METFMKLSDSGETAAKNETTLRALPTQTLSSHFGQRTTNSYPLLRRISTTPKDDGPLDYRKGESLGQGGMGQVYQAEQVSLQRDVAIKEVHRGDKELLFSHRLIHEARLVGKLEHPNVAPVYELGQTQDGMPLLVMKRIDGIAWSELLGDPNHLFWENIQGDRLVWNIGVLIQICNAVEYAHAQGIIHRDIKPENIMLGHYGEIYLLDWGLGFSINDDDHSYIPVAAGTPAYMAPEMLRSLEEIDFRTDVYLLGALLYELLSGEPPHKGDSAPEAIRNILEQREPALPKDLPDDIKNICHQAISFNKGNRFASVGVFRSKLQEHLTRRTSNQLVDECITKKDELVKFLAELETDPQSDSIYEKCSRNYLETQVSMGLALKQWPENHKAKTLQAELHATMIRVELERKSLDHVNALLHNLDNVPLDIEQNIESLSAKLHDDEKRRNELEQLAAQQDKSVGASARSGMFKTLIVIAIILQVTFIAKTQIQNNQITTAELFYSFVVILAVSLVVIFRRRKSLWANERSKMVTNSILSILTLIFMVRLEALLTNISPLECATNEVMMGIGFFTMHAVTLFRMSWFIVGFGVICLTLLSLFPSQLELIFGTYLLGAVVMSYVMSSVEVESS